MISLVAGAVGTTFLSAWTGDVFFTWPVYVFVVFDWLARSLKWKRRPETTRKEKLADWCRVGAFVAVSMVYFLLCRRLSLVTEWVFLVGFPAALPFSRISARFEQRSSVKAMIVCLVSTLVGFSAYYAAAVKLLELKYRPTRQVHPPEIARCFSRLVEVP